MSKRGIVRNVDKLGRIVIPKYMLDILEIDAGDPVEIYLDDTTVHIRKYEEDNSVMKQLKMLELIIADENLGKNKTNTLNTYVKAMADIIKE